MEHERGHSPGLVIIGAGGLGRETAWMVQEINIASPAWKLLGFIDEDCKNHNKILNGVPVLGGFDCVEDIACRHRPLYAVCAVANPAGKKNLVKKALACGLLFANIIHPSVTISPFARLGTGIIVAANTIITVNVTLGNHVAINPGCGIGHDVEIQDYTTLFWHVNLSGNVTIESECLLGTKTVVIQGVTVGRKTITGAGAVVVHDIPACCTVAGVPAKPIQ